MMSSISAVLLALLSACVKEGAAITCYMCNSAPSRNDRLCDSRALKGNNDSAFIQDCDLLPRDDDRNYTVCRKIHQTILDNDGNEEERVIRQCGTEQSPLGCSWRTRPNTLQVATCHCAADLCNAAPHPAGNTPGIVFCTAAVLISLVLLSGQLHFRSGQNFV
ncbi:hypothetical protein ACOMHN_052631 [Nucella lapillus]